MVVKVVVVALPVVMANVCCGNVHIQAHIKNQKKSCYVLVLKCSNTTDDDDDGQPPKNAETLRQPCFCFLLHIIMFILK